MLHSEGAFHEASDAGSTFCVAKNCFDGANIEYILIGGAWLVGQITCSFHSVAEECLIDRGRFLRITGRGACSMGLKKLTTVFAFSRI